MNRLGHGVSYTKLEDIDTALCLNKLALSPDGEVALLTKTYQGVPATLRFDIIDHLEETLSGGSTSH